MAKQTLFGRHELEIAEQLPEGQLTIASGAKYEKSDVQVERSKSTVWWRSLVECKCTQAKSFSITKELWDLVSNRVYERSAEMRPVLSIRFYGSSKAQAQDVAVLTDLVVLDKDDWIELLQENYTLREKLGEYERDSRT